MTTDANDDYTELRTQLIDAGVPAPVVDYAISHRPSSSLYTGFSVALNIALVIVGAAFWVFAAYVVKGVAELNAIAQHANGVLVLTHMWSFAIAGLFAWFLAATIIVYRLSLIFPRARVSQFVYTLLREREEMFFRKKRVAEALKTEHDPERYIRRTFKNWLSVTKWMCLVLFAVTAFLLSRDLNYYTVVSHDGYIATSYFPGFGKTEGEWSTTRLLELGCNHISGSDINDDIKYTIHMNNGTTLDLGEATPVAGTWLDHIEAIDRALQQESVPIQRWEWFGREPLHPACMRAQQDAHTPEDYQRILKLLRVGSFPGDPPID